MKTSILFLLSCAGLMAQNCTVRNTFVITGTQTYDNRTPQCTNFTFSYFVSGFSAISIEVDGAPDSGGIPGLWTALTPATGSNPSTTLTGVSSYSGAVFPWVRINVTSVTGPGTVSFQLLGNATASSSGTISGSVTVTNFPSVQAISGNVGITGTPSVSVSNFPATQPVSGSVSVSNFPATQPISGNVGITGTPSVSVSNFPATQPVSGSVSTVNGALETGGNLATVAGAVTSSIMQDNIKQVGGSAVVTAATGVQLIGIEGRAGTSLETVAGSLNSVILPTTSGSATFLSSFQNAFTVVNVKNSSGNLYGFSVYNPNVTVIYLQMYNTAGTPVLGTSVVGYYALTPSSVTTFISPIPVENFGAGIGIGASTTPTSTGTPTTAPVGVIFYR